MHDWVLNSIYFDWQSGTALLIFSTCINGNYVYVTLHCYNVTEFNIPKKEEWGPSVSVYGYRGPEKIDKKNNKLTIEMQTGDEIVLIAERFVCRELGLS